MVRRGVAAVTVAGLWQVQGTGKMQPEKRDQTR